MVLRLPVAAAMFPVNFGGCAARLVWVERIICNNWLWGTCGSHAIFENYLVIGDFSVQISCIRDSWQEVWKDAGHLMDNSER